VASYHAEVAVTTTPTRIDIPNRAVTIQNQPESTSNVYMTRDERTVGGVVLAPLGSASIRGVNGVWVRTKTGTATVNVEELS